MLDIHCHILPGVDDGPGTLADSLEVARRCAQDGITHIVATPHCHRFLRLLRADVLPHVARLNEALARAGLALAVFPGSEIQLTDPAAYRRDYERGLYCHLGDDRRYTLLEFPWREALYPTGAADHVAWLRAQGTTPIIAHPERHGYFRDAPERLAALVAAGAWIQITVDSLLGNHGADAAEAAGDMLQAYPEAVLATDTHGLDRCSGLTAGYAWVRDRFGAARADDLLGRSNLILQHLLAVRGGAAAAPERNRHESR
jgi:protein-tyrosine phosphatase